MKKDFFSNKDVVSLKNYNLNKNELINKFKKFLLNSNNALTKSINGVFIYIDIEKAFVMIYGNNGDIIKSSEELSILTFEEFKKIFYNDDFEKLINNLKSDSKNIEVKIKNYESKDLWINVKGETIKNKEGQVVEFIGCLNNITREKELELELKVLRTYDELTGLNNKKNFNKIINEEIKNHFKLKKRGAFIMINLDNFKFINDSCGHEAGDLYLKEFSRKLRRLISDEKYACRFSVDEFIVFLPYINSIDEINDFSKKIMSLFEDSYYIMDKNIYTTASIGVSLFPDDGQSFESLLKSADSALYKAKTNGKNQKQMFNDKISEEINRIYLIHKGLRRALEKNEMYVVFQPKIKLHNNEVDGFEALLRWNSREIGFISPAEFIPISESTRLIIPIGKFVLREVFSKIRYLLNEGYDNFKIAVNLSEIQLRDGGLVSYFNSLVKEYNVSPEYIELEITESMLMKSVDNNIECLMELKRLGASIALDDFGTGYSSLNHLTKLPIDVLKIDRSFLIDMKKNNKSKYIIENIIELSHKLNITVVAEGVEEKEQVKYLRSIKCDKVQGYYYSKPQEFKYIINMLSKKDS